MQITPALDLGDLGGRERQQVKLKASTHAEPRLYELRYDADLSMEQIARLQTLTERAEPMVGKEIVDVATAQSLDAWLDEAMGIVFHTPLEPETLAEMGCMPKWRVLQFFGETCMTDGEAVQVGTPTPKAKRQPTRTSIGAS